MCKNPDCVEGYVEPKDDVKVRLIASMLGNKSLTELMKKFGDKCPDCN